MTAMDQAGYIIHEDTLYSVPKKVRKYQKLTTGWKQTSRYMDNSNRPKKYNKDK